MSSRGARQTRAHFPYNERPDGFLNRRISQSESRIPDALLSIRQRKVKYSSRTAQTRTTAKNKARWESVKSPFKGSFNTTLRSVLTLGQTEQALHLVKHTNREVTFGLLLSDLSRHNVPAGRNVLLPCKNNPCFAFSLGTCYNRTGWVGILLTLLETNNTPRYSERILQSRFYRLEW